MNIQSFLNCANVNGISTGNAIQSIYSLQSGDNNVIYNLLQPTGNAYNSGIIYSPSFPLINVGQPIYNSYFSGVQNFRMGYSMSGDFGLLIDLSYNACQKQNLIDYCILSSNTLDNLNKNFILTINDANRLNFKISGGNNYTLSKELSTRDIVYFSLIQHQYITFGIFNVGDNQFYSKNIDLSTNKLNSDIVYIGSEFNNQTTTGFFGNISNIILFSDPQINLNNCVECYFTTGFNLIDNIITVNIPQITGFYYSGINNIFNYTSLNSGLIPKINGSNINIEFNYSYESGISSGVIVNPLFSSTGININQPYYKFYKDTGIISSFNKYQIDFTNSLTSGDSLEIYSYYYPIPNIGVELIGLDISNINGIMQLIGNGINETFNIDYNIVRNKVSGFYPNDFLSYDLLNSQSITVNFNGYFDNVFTGSIGLNPILNVTGLSGINFNNINYPEFGYDIFLNGQKLISGYEFSVQNSGVSGFNIFISGGEIMNPDYNAIDNAELAFIPQFDNFIYFLSGVNQDTSIISGNFGFSEQVWINGVRQIRNIDYFLINPCSTINSISNNADLPFLFYNNDSTWNFVFPPINNGFSINFSTGIGILNINSVWNQINLLNYSSGQYLEVWGESGNNGFYLLNTLDVGSTGYNWQISPIIHQNYAIKTRYRYNNIISDFSSGIYGNY